MEIPYSYIENYSKALNAVSEQARKKLVNALAGIDYTMPIADIRNAVIAIMQPACGASADVAAQLAADFYDGLRARFGIDDGYTAEAESLREPGATDGAVRAMVQDLVEDKPISQFIGACSDRIDYETRKAANECVAYNAKNDPRKTKWARIPTGAETCNWCIMLASRGFAYHTEEAASHAHAHCDCRIVPSWDKSPTAQGYDPALYYEMWKHPERFAEQENAALQSPDVPSLTKTLKDTSIEECATHTNPNRKLVSETKQRANELAAKLNAMMPLTSENIAEYTEKYREWESLNEEYKKLYKKWHQNCQRCVPAYELRRRGYDVTAAPRKTRNDTVASSWDSLFKNQEWRSVGGEDRAEALLNLEAEIKLGEKGSRYAITLWWQGQNAGHTFVAENVDGMIRYIDPQTGDTEYLSWRNRFSPNDVRVSRIDNLEFDEQYIGSAVVVKK